LRKSFLPATILVAACLLLWACFEEPVVERLHLRFLPGAVEVTASLEIHDSPYGSEPLTRRLRQLERSVLSGDDPWSQRFQHLDPERESFRWEKEEGQLVRAEHRAMSERPRRLERFFGDTAVLAQYERGSFEATGVEARGGWASFGLYPGPSSRADRQQTRKVAETLEQWSALAARHLEATEGLYRYLERYPERAAPCLTALYIDLLEDTEEPEISREEEERVEEVAKAIGELSEILELDRDEGYSLNELSRLVHDPFPARITVEVPGEILEVEGFEVLSDAGETPGSEPRRLSIPGLGLWESWLALEGVWVFPDPAASFYYLALQEDPDAAFPALLAAERWVEPAPRVGEVRSELEDLLRPEPAYRVVWRERRPGTEGEAPPEPAPDFGSR